MTLGVASAAPVTKQEQDKLTPGAQTQKMTVYFVDDDATARATIAILLESEGMETRCFATAEEFLDAAAGNMRGCVVTDVKLPGTNGIELIGRLRRQGVGLPVIVISGHANLALAVQAMKQGAVDFIEKPYSAKALLDAIRSACASAEGRDAEPAERAAIRKHLSELTTREKAVMLKLTGGAPNKVIAFETGLSIRTIEGYRAAIMKKMHCGSLAELVRKCIAIGMVRDQGSLH